MNLVCFSALAYYTSGAEVCTLLVYTFPIYNLKTNKSLSDIIQLEISVVPPSSPQALFISDV